MDSEWNDSQPIYRQLRDLVVAMAERQKFLAYGQRKP
jgi:hypothetical protein